MKYKPLAWQTAVAVGVTICALSASAVTPKDAVCALQQAIACGPYESCERALPEAVNLPALMRFDLDAGTIESRFEGGAVRASKIASSSSEGDVLILQGVDAGHPWAIRVDTGDGRFTLNVLRDDEAFVGFGVCSARILE